MEQRPKYIEIHEWIRSQIFSGKLKPGERMYSENELMELFSVSRQTIRHAISKLEFEGIVERKRGSGTYILEKKQKVKNVKNMQFAVITTYIDVYIFPRIIQEIEQTISKEGYTLQIASTYNSIEKEQEILKKILKENIVDGIIVEAARSALPNPNLPLYRQIMEKKIPLVFLNSYYPELPVPHISLNDKMAGKQATQYLIRKGHRKISAIFKSDDGQGHLRYAGYIDALMEAKIQIKEDRIMWISTEDMRSMHQEEQRYLDRIRNCTACVCYNDNVAAGLMEICKDHRIMVPENLSIVGIDDAEVAKRPEVSLTTVQNPVRKLGVLCASILLKMVKGQEVENCIELTGEMIERDTVYNKRKTTIAKDII